MQKAVKIFFILIFLGIIASFYLGCKKDEPFDIRGVWEFIENRDNRETASTFEVILEGSTVEGTVEKHPVKDDYWRGTYQVDQNQIFINVSYCRGIACMTTNYQGSIIYEKLITGLLEGYSSIGVEVSGTWSGTWELRRE